MLILLKMGSSTSGGNHSQRRVKRHLNSETLLARNSIDPEVREATAGEKSDPSSTSHAALVCEAVAYVALACTHLPPRF